MRRASHRSRPVPEATWRRSLQDMRDAPLTKAGQGGPVDSCIHNPRGGMRCLLTNDDGLAFSDAGSHRLSGIALIHSSQREPLTV